jgi:hypothetical protein
LAALFRTLVIREPRRGTLAMLKPEPLGAQKGSYLVDLVAGRLQPGGPGRSAVLHTVLAAFAGLGRLIADHRADLGQRTAQGPMYSDDPRQFHILGTEGLHGRERPCGLAPAPASRARRRIAPSHAGGRWLGRIRNLHGAFFLFAGDDGATEAQIALGLLHGRSNIFGRPVIPIHGIRKQTGCENVAATALT